MDDVFYDAFADQEPSGSALSATVARDGGARTATTMATPTMKTTKPTRTGATPETAAAAAAATGGTLRTEPARTKQGICDELARHTEWQFAVLFTASGRNIAQYGAVGDAGAHTSAESAGASRQRQQRQQWRPQEQHEQCQYSMASTRTHHELQPDELRALAQVLDSRETAVWRGIDVDNRHFDVHRWHGGAEDCTRAAPAVALAYGRRGTAVASEGAAVARCVSDSSRDTLCMLVTYLLPELSASAVHSMRMALKAYARDMAESDGD